MHKNIELLSIWYVENKQIDCYVSQPIMTFLIPRKLNNFYEMWVYIKWIKPYVSQGKEVYRIYRIICDYS